ncbi:MAG: rRNA ((966)-N(2))-methyltransferase RsmD [Pseudomonadota bacterium]
MSSPPRRPTHRPTPAVAHQVRIIGGQWKRTPLPVLTSPDLRPTPDRVRETVFNWLQHLVGHQWPQIRCLDLFSGSGALGFEAASRGAKSVTLVENQSAVVKQLEALKEKLKAEHIAILRGDAVLSAQRLISQQQRFDLIFLDPPYQQGWLEKTLPLCQHLLESNGLVYAEAAAALPLGESEHAWLAGWEVVRADKAGMVFYHLLRRCT